MKKKFLCVFIIIAVLIFPFCLMPTANAKADDLSDAVKDQLDNIDLDGLESYFDSTDTGNFDFLSVFKKLLNGEYDGEESVFNYIKDILLSDVKELLPILISVIIAALLCEMIQKVKSTYLSDSVGSVIKFVTILTIILLLSAEFISLWQTTKNIIENIGKFSEIMSPIILTLMVASGGSVSAAMYKPSVVFFTDIVINVFYAAVLPLIGIYTIFNILSHFSKEIKLKKFSDFFGSVIKWIFGILAVIYGFMITAQGVSVSITDGISVKVAKYAISSSVPIVGGLLKDGFDVISAGSVLIKNALGIAGVMGLFYFILSPVIRMAVFSVLIKFAAAVSDIYSDGTVSDFLVTISKSVTYFIAAVLTVGFMAFLTILLMILSANTVV